MSHVLFSRIRVVPLKVGLAALGALVLAWSPAVASPSDQALSPAGVVVAQLQTSLPLTLVADFTADSDPEHLLGLSGQYISKAAFVDSSIAASTANGPTGIVEVFSSPSELNVRYAVVSTRAGSLEHDIASGTVLLRLVGSTPDSALLQYQTALSNVVLR
jgi:hypothetical protein